MNINEMKLMLEEALQSKNNDLNTFSATVRDMEIQICTQLDLLKLTEEKLVSNTEKLKLEEKQVKMLKAEVEVSKVSIISLNKDKSYLLNELEERNRNYGNLEKAYKEQTIQLIELQNSMKALEAQTLTSKLVRVAKKFIRVPLKVLETVSTQC